MTIKATKNLSWDEWLTVWWGRLKGSRDSDDLHFSGPKFVVVEHGPRRCRWAWRPHARRSAAHPSATTWWDSEPSATHDNHTARA